MAAEILWKPTKAGNTSMDRYRYHINRRFGLDLRDSFELHTWSVTKPHDFWIDLYTYLELKPPLPGSITKAYDDSCPMSAAPAFFPGLEFNYAENALFSNPDPDAIALIGLREGDTSDKASEKMTWREFRDQVRLAASALRAHGVKKGDRVAALLATGIWVMVLYHATASIGAIFTSVSPDLGVSGCVSRFKQVSPRILFVDSHVLWKGKMSSTSAKVKQILEQVEPSPSVFIVPFTQEKSEHPSIHDFMARANPAEPLTFERVPFNYPLLICYTSGTTSSPKCIVHHHGVIIQMKKISIVHNETTPADVILQYSSTSWIVFNIMCGYFACGATTLVYNGSPMYPDNKALLRLIEKYKVTYFGTSPRFLLELQMAKCTPKAEFDLSSLRITYTTGATLTPSQYRWFYASFPAHIHLCNTAGGTDTCTSLLAADPCSPVRAGEMIFALGMDIDILDPDTGDSIMESGEAGEMVIKTPFPSMPCFFWGDARGAKYHEAYFERFAALDVWAQADWLSKSRETGGYTMHGRSDGVLNPSGIRFGSGEIYGIVEAEPFTKSVSNTLCVGRRRKQDADEDVFLFIVMRDEQALDEALIADVQDAIRRNLSARHVPRFIVQVPDIPLTVNGKKVEAAVKQIISGKDVVPSNTVQNPESFGYFRRFRSLERKPRASKL